jgi:hypothetical protein
VQERLHGTVRHSGVSSQTAAISIAIDAKLGLDKSIHDDVASFEHLPKTSTYRNQLFVVIDIESPNSAGANVIPASDALGPVPRFDSRRWPFTPRPSSSATLWLITEALAPLSNVTAAAGNR